MLGLLEVDGAQAFLTDTGRAWYTADSQTSKQIFARLTGDKAPLVRTIDKALENSDDGTLRDGFFRDLLRAGFTPTTSNCSTTTPTPAKSSSAKSPLASPSTSVEPPLRVADGRAQRPGQH